MSDLNFSSGSGVRRAAIRAHVKGASSRQSVECHWLSPDGRSICPPVSQWGGGSECYKSYWVVCELWSFSSDVACDVVFMRMCVLRYRLRWSLWISLILIQSWRSLCLCTPVRCTPHWTERVWNSRLRRPWNRPRWTHGTRVNTSYRELRGSKTPGFISSIHIVIRQNSGQD